MNKKELVSRYLLDNASKLNEQATARDILANPDAYDIGYNQLDTLKGGMGAILNQMGKGGAVLDNPHYGVYGDEVQSFKKLKDDDTSAQDIIDASVRIAGDTKLKEQFQASGLDRRALGLLKNKDKSDLKNIIRSVVYELADDGYDEGDIQDFLGLIVRGEVKMNYKKAVR